MTTKKKKKPVEANLKQQEFDFSNKFYIKWHCTGIDKGKGYKTHSRIVKSIVNDKKIKFNNLTEATDYIERILIKQFLANEIFIEKNTNQDIIKEYYENKIIKDTQNLILIKFIIPDCYKEYWIEICKE